MSQAGSVAAVVGEQLRAWRQAAGLRQDEVAAAARELDLRWTRATVAAIELGRRDISLEELLALPFIVGKFPRVGNGQWRRMSGFVTASPSGVVAIGPDSWLRTDHVKSLLSGAPAGGRQVPMSALYSTRAARRAIQRRVDAEFDAEIKAARRLGVSEVEITAVARRLWDRTLTAERDARVAERAPKDATPRTLQAHRGHVTRSLVAELAAELDQQTRGK